MNEFKIFKKPLSRYSRLIVISPDAVHMINQHKGGYYPKKGKNGYFLASDNLEFTITKLDPEMLKKFERDADTGIVETNEINPDLLAIRSKFDHMYFERAIELFNRYLT